MFIILIRFQFFCKKYQWSDLKYHLCCHCCYIAQVALNMTDDSLPHISLLYSRVDPPPVRAASTWISIPAITRRPCLPLLQPLPERAVVTYSGTGRAYGTVRVRASYRLQQQGKSYGLILGVALAVAAGEELGPHSGSSAGCSRRRRVRDSYWEQRWL